MDTWLLLANLQLNGERTRTLQVVKSRGIAHSNQVREFVMGDDGVALVDVYLLGDQVLTGSARTAQQAIAARHPASPGRTVSGHPGAARARNGAAGERARKVNR
jgi:hypothetical protein